MGSGNEECVRDERAMQQRAWGRSFFDISGCPSPIAIALPIDKLRETPLKTTAISPRLGHAHSQR